jgi:hypothetical protein
VLRSRGLQQSVNGCSFGGLLIWSGVRFSLGGEFIVSSITVEAVWTSAILRTRLRLSTAFFSLRYFSFWIIQPDVISVLRPVKLPIASHLLSGFSPYFLTPIDAWRTEFLVSGACPGSNFRQV